MNDDRAILGAGSWGTALAVHLARAGHDVRLWARDAALVAEIARTRRANGRYLPDVALADRVIADGHRSRRRSTGARSSSWRCRRTACARCVRASRRICEPGAIVVSAPRGSRPTRCSACRRCIDEETAGRCRSSCSPGPSFAREVARGLPTAVLVGVGATRRLRRACRNSSAGPALRLYGSDDVTGVEIGGALKNVIAIAAGVVEGLGLGHNAMAALITRGLAEISRLACARAGGARRWRV